MKDVSVLVTGSSGTIGTALSEALIAAGADVVGVDVRSNRWSPEVDAVTETVDLTDPDAVKSLPEADYVAHLAAHSRVEESIEEPATAVENVRMTEAVLEHARRTGGGVLFTSSREVYGDGEQRVCAEADAAIGGAANPYGGGKIACEAMVAAHSRCYDLDAVTLRLTNVYGRYDAKDRVVPLFIALARSGEDLVVYGEEKLLDFVYIDDCIGAMMAALENFESLPGKVINIGAGECVTLIELAKEIVDCVGTEVGVEVEPNRRGEVSRFVADVTRARRLLGYAPDYDLVSGIEEAVAWYSDHQPIFDEIE